MGGITRTDFPCVPGRLCKGDGALGLCALQIERGGGEGADGTEEVGLVGHGEGKCAHVGQGIAREVEASVEGIAGGEAVGEDLCVGRPHAVHADGGETAGPAIVAEGEARQVAQGVGEVGHGLAGERGTVKREVRRHLHLQRPKGQGTRLGESVGGLGREDEGEEEEKSPRTPQAPRRGDVVVETPFEEEVDDTRKKMHGRLPRLYLGADDWETALRQVSWLVAATAPSRPAGQWLRVIARSNSQLRDSAGLSPASLLSAPRPVITPSSGLSGCAAPQATANLRISPQMAKPRPYGFVGQCSLPICRCFR